MGKMVVKVGPSDHGRRMSLQEFDKAEVQEGYLYELGRGVIVVSDVPAPRHLAMVNAIRRQLMAYDLAKRMEAAGFEWRGEHIWNQTGQRLYPFGYPFAYVPNTVHHTITIFRKPR